MLAKKIALIGSSACFLWASRAFTAQAAGPGRVYTSIREESEFTRLLPLPVPLLANFCMLVDPKSREVSDTLTSIVESGKAAFQVSAVDVEIDEPAAQDLVQRYIVAKIPTIVAFSGGEPVQSLEPSASGKELEGEILDWIARLPIDKN